MSDPGKTEIRCEVCPRGCLLREGQTGACRARSAGKTGTTSLNYGKITGLALDPIEKKPLACYRPGSRILSIGSFGCNLFCPFCQNYEISQTGLSEEAERTRLFVREMTPEQLCALADELRGEGNIGLAYTYNEPLVGWEFVRDTARLVKEAGMDNVVVTNGCVKKEILREVLPCIDAMNIDLKAFTEEGYVRLGGDLQTVQETIRLASRECHVEVTSLIVPGLNDTEEDMEREAAWLAGIDPFIPLHITRFFPRYRMNTGEPTSVRLMEKLEKTAKKHLQRVYLGNI
ncbi:MAG: AmmeMemoRadiSam system radical SAM enzyme [Lachnospiraceae bacterium]|nr:AmmeMemoRadiSam system radical SAM enzyme [Lachnospiraceae bacterium]